MIGGNLGAAVQMLKVMNQQGVGNIFYNGASGVTADTTEVTADTTVITADNDYIIYYALNDRSAIHRATSTDLNT